MRAAALFLPAVAAHSAMTIPEPRNAVDSNEQPWGGAVPHPLPFEPWCPIPSKVRTNRSSAPFASRANPHASFAGGRRHR